MYVQIPMYAVETILTNSRADRARRPDLILSRLESVTQ